MRKVREGVTRVLLKKTGAPTLSKVAPVLLSRMLFLEFQNAVVFGVI